eukprot:Unigene15150_Nuclearia_a/m.45367 Unigene15150_Nuclearia_a/g.45367  ORF Unigene15150_Nuclearia_a/g.45367 Unigene15150_Nuclearia_a/m.45367 type:complete len:277 (-) Unigene15150_Nuclearia_a:50-880(-)
MMQRTVITATSAVLLRHREPTCPHVDVWTLNRPQQRNGLSLALMHALLDAADSVRADGHATRAIVLRANGPAFCAGHDLKELHGTPADERPARYREVFALCSRMMLALRALPQPVVAQVDGVATAAGCQLIAACDLAYASPAATFATPGVNVGLFCSTPAVPLVRAVQRKHAMEMLLLGEPISAARACEIGLINGTFAREELSDAVMRIAGQIASKSAATIALGKRVLRAQEAAADEEAAYAIASDGMVENLLGRDDAREGIAAFVEKRAPRWSHS